MSANRWLLAGLLICLAPTHAATAVAFDPGNASIRELRAALDSGRVSSQDLVRYYLQRIERFDKTGPCINAVITLNPAVLEDAARIDAAAGQRRVHGPLYGIPFVAKDNYDTAGLPTTGGSAALMHSVPQANAVVIQRLLDQGAILIGKTNMSELAASYGRLGYSSAGGLTVNPYDTSRNVSGSSSGSAAAVAADFAAFAVGTDTSGSVRGPASVAGLAGIRPTLGLLSRTGIMPLSLTVDTPGVMARTVVDLATVLDAIAGVDPQDAATVNQPSAHGHANAFRTRSLRGTRLGVVAQFDGGNAEVDEIEKGALARLAKQGAVLIPVALPAQYLDLWRSVLGPVGAAEFKPQFERYLKTLPPPGPKTLAELIRISMSPAVANSVTPVNPEGLQALELAESTSLTDSPAYIHVLTDVIPRLREGLRRLMAAERLQGLVFPTLSCPPSPRFDRPDPSYRCDAADPYAAGYIASATGFPEVTVPAGRATGNLPVGISFLGIPFGEARLLEMASAFQRAGPAFAPPRLR